MKYYINNWRDWQDLAWSYNADPWNELEFSVDKGGGNTDDYYYIGDVPEREE